MPSQPLPLQTEIKGTLQVCLEEEISPRMGEKIID